MTEPSTPLHFEEEERLPWLEPINDVEQNEGSTGRLIGLVLAGLVGIGLVVGGLWWWQNNGGRARGELIAAPDSDYKTTPPAEPDRFDGDGNVAVAASEGVRPESRVNADQLPEQPVPPAAATAPNRPAAATSRPAASTPVAGGTATAANRTTAGGAGASAPAATAAAAATPATGGGTIQLGAFASEATAARAWDGLKGRFAFLAPVNRSIVSATVNGRTVYRLQAAAGSASAARDFCNRLRVAGENCLVLR